MKTICKIVLQVSEKKVRGGAAGFGNPAGARSKGDDWSKRGTLRHPGISDKEASARSSQSQICP